MNTATHEHHHTTISRAAIPLTPVDSSQISAIGHDPQTNTLAVQFAPRPGAKQGQVYHYGNVDAAFFERFRSAESLGKFFHKEIKANASAYPYAKIDSDEA